MTAITRRRALMLAGTAALVVATPAIASAQRRPNIIFVLVDDLRWDEFGAAGHPWLETPNIDRLAREGAMFTQAIHVIPLCSPNRATLLTGQYPSRHGVTGNEARSELSHRLVTFPQALHADGYRTGFIGKWHMGNDPTPRPGFDYWVSFPGQGKIIDPELYENGKLTKTPGHVTDLLNDRAIGFLRTAAGSGQPFFLMLSHKAIHPDTVQRNDGSIDLTAPRDFIPAPRHAGRYADKTFPRRANYLPPGTVPPGDSQVSALLARKYGAQTTAKYGDEIDASTAEATIRSRAEMLLAIDEGLGQLIATLEAAGTLDNTAIIFTGDNGYFYGEHGLSVERRLPYEEAVRMPLLLRLPGVAQPGSKIDALLSSVDLAPTMLALAGVVPGPQVQGVSILPALRGRPVRRAAYIEYNGDEVFDWVDDAGYRAVRTDRFKLIHWLQHPQRNELYDLVADPFEQRNVVADPRYARPLAELGAELRRQSNAALGL